MSYAPPIFIYPGSSSGDFIFPVGLSSLTDRTPSTTQSATAIPFFLGSGVTVDQIGVYLTTAQAGAEIWGAVYGNSGGRPSGLLYDLGALDCSSGGAADKVWSLSPSVRFSGFIWCVIWHKTVATQATFKGPSTVITAGFFPATSANLSGATMPKPYLVLANATYPVSAAPPTAPAVAPTAAASVALCQLRAA